MSDQPLPPQLNLSDLRQEIDEVDTQLIAVLAHRLELVKYVGKYKKQHNLPPLSPERWQEVVTTRIKLAKAKGINEHFMSIILEAIHNHALELEKEV